MPQPVSVETEGQNQQASSRRRGQGLGARRGSCGQVRFDHGPPSGRAGTAAPRAEGVIYYVVAEADIVRRGRAEYVRALLHDGRRRRARQGPL